MPPAHAPRACLALLACAALAPAQLSFPPDWTADSGQAASGFGASVASAGDVNGDGYDDVLVGAPTFTSGEFFEGRAFLFLGSPAGLAAGAAWSVEGNVAWAQFGACVAGAGDVNGDGFDDVLVGAPDWFAGANFDFEGRASLYLGSAAGLATSAAWIVEGDLPGGHFGAALAGAGDVDGDGFDDVLVGAPGAAPGGRVSVFHGSAAGLSPVAAAVRLSPQAGASFGQAVAGAGDVNGDGFADVLVGAPLLDGGAGAAGGAFAFLGSASGVGAAPAWSAGNGVPGSLFGASVAGAGDVDGDGFDELLVGAELCDTGLWEEGRAYLYRGGAAGPGALPAWTAGGDLAGAHFGASVAGAGDVNGDGFDDVVIGAWRYQDGPASGRVLAWLGSQAGLEALPSWSAGGSAAKPFLGTSVCGAGDVNGDGLQDVLAGGQNFDQGWQHAQAHHGGPWASVAPYGAGKGSAQKLAPRLWSGAPPSLGGTATLDFAKGEAGQIPFLLTGFQPAALAWDLGTLHVQPFSVTYLAPLPASGGYSLPLAIPAWPELQDVDVYFQSGYFTFSAPGPHHTFQTNGLHWTLGQ